MIYWAELDRDPGLWERITDAQLAEKLADVVWMLQGAPNAAYSHMRAGQVREEWQRRGREQGGIMGDLHHRIDGPGRRLGRHVHHDPRSRNFPAVTAGALKTVSHRHYGPVLDQGDLGACTGNALAQALMSAPLHKPKRTLDEGHALDLYSRATVLDPFPGAWPPDDTGSDGLSVCKAGVAAGYLTGYTHTFSLDDCLAALVVQPVIVGTNWYSSMYQPDSAGLVSVAPGAKVRGGHEYCLLRLDTTRRLVGAVNSWGPGWGAAGFFWMSWATLERLLGEHGDCTVPVAA